MLIHSKHCHFHLSIHLIFVCKYRKKLFLGKIGDEIKQLLLTRSDESKTFEIKTIEVDQDHVHMIVDFTPGETVQNIVKQLKSYTVFHIWNSHPELEHQFWKRKMFWSDGYFACSIGDASCETIQRYIETQGGRPQLIHPRS